jgi:hypothetical protein
VFCFNGFGGIDEGSDDGCDDGWRDGMEDGSWLVFELGFVKGSDHGWRYSIETASITLWWVERTTKSKQKSQSHNRDTLYYNHFDSSFHHRPPHKILVKLSAKMMIGLPLGPGRWQIQRQIQLLKAGRYTQADTTSNRPCKIKGILA